MQRPSQPGGSGPPSDGREKRIDVRFDEPGAFRAAMLDLQPAGLFVAGRYDVHVGDPVVVRCIFPGLPDGIPIRANVLWRRLTAGGDPSSTPGLGLVVRSVSMSSFRKLVDYAEGKLDLPGRKEERFVARYKVRCTVGTRNPVEVAGEMADISLEGAALRIQHRASVGDKLALRVQHGRGDELELDAFVTWVRGQGAAMLVGVEVQFPRRADLETWERLVARAKAEARLSTEFPSD